MKEIRTVAVPLLVSAGGFLTFVAVVGGAVVWLRFYRLGIPVEQAVDVLPKTELIAIGAGPLVLFGVLGILALAAMYLLDRGGRATRRTFFGLIGLFVAESFIVIYLSRYETTRNDKIAAALVVATSFFFAVAVSFWFRRRDEPRAPALEDESAEERPDRFRLTSLGRILLVAALAGVATSFGIVTWSAWWPAAAIVVAGIVTLALYRVAWATVARFAWFGVAVFFSLPAFVAAAFILQLFSRPLAQPVAAIRSVNGSLEAFEGIYVTETDDRLVLASLATVGCDDDGLRQGAGRLYKVPLAEVTSMELGSLQPVQSTGERARTMRLDLVRRALAMPARQAGDENGAKTRQEDTSPAPKRAVRLATRALRGEPDIYEPLPEIKPGALLKIRGMGFGDTEGVVMVGPSRARVRKGDWTDDLIKARLPPKTRSGILRVICPEPGIVRILRRPTALAQAVPRRGRGSYRLDASRSRDRDGQIVRYSWVADGESLGQGKAVKRVPIEAGRRVHRIDLTVTDDDGLRSSDSLFLVRLPAKLLFCFDCRALSPNGQREIGRLRMFVARTGFVRIDGHADFIGSDRYNFLLSRDRACAVAQALAGSGRSSVPKFALYAHGEESPIDPGTTSAGRARNRRVEILLDDTRTPPIPRGGERVRC